MRRDQIPGWFAAWFALCALVAIGAIGVGVWAVITLVQWVVSR